MHANTNFVGEIDTSFCVCNTYKLVSDKIGNETGFERNTDVLVI